MSKEKSRKGIFDFALYTKILPNKERIADIKDKILVTHYTSSPYIKYDKRDKVSNKVYVKTYISVMDKNYKHLYYIRYDAKWSGVGLRLNGYAINKHVGNMYPTPPNDMAFCGCHMEQNKTISIDFSKATVERTNMFDIQNKYGFFENMLNTDSIDYLSDEVFYIIRDEKEEYIISAMESFRGFYAFDECFTVANYILYPNALSRLIKSNVVENNTRHIHLYNRVKKVDAPCLAFFCSSPDKERLFNGIYEESICTKRIVAQPPFEKPIKMKADILYSKNGVHKLLYNVYATDVLNAYEDEILTTRILHPNSKIHDQKTGKRDESHDNMMQLGSPTTEIDGDGSGGSRISSKPGSDNTIDYDPRKKTFGEFKRPNNFYYINNGKAEELGGRTIYEDIGDCGQTTDEHSRRDGDLLPVRNTESRLEERIDENEKDGEDIADKERTELFEELGWKLEESRSFVFPMLVKKIAGKHEVIGGHKSKGFSDADKNLRHYYIHKIVKDGVGFAILDAQKRTYIDSSGDEKSDSVGIIVARWNGSVIEFNEVYAIKLATNIMRYGQSWLTVADGEDGPKLDVDYFTVKHCKSLKNTVRAIVGRIKDGELMKN